MGKGATQKKEAKFRTMKNKSFQSELTASLMSRLKLTDQTSIMAIKLQSTIIPQGVPISFRGLPVLARVVWSRMQSIGTRPFQQLATEENFAIFVKCLLYICEAKLVYAQASCTNHPSSGLPSLDQYSEMQLRIIRTLATKLPYPLAVYVEAIGNFVADKQMFVPLLIRVNPQAASGVVSYAPSHLRELMRVCQDFVPADNVVANVANGIDDLPIIEWVQGHIEVPVPPIDGAAQPPHLVPAVRAADRTFQFWSARFLSHVEIDTFHKIISTLDSKRGFNILVDITPGDGSIVQAVRFPEELDHDVDEIQYYSMTDIPPFEERLAPALLLGFEYRGDAKSRLLGHPNYCLLKGTASLREARYALSWYHFE